MDRYCGRKSKVMVKSGAAAILLGVGLQFSVVSGALSAGIARVKFSAAKEQSITLVKQKRTKRYVRYRHNRRLTRALPPVPGRGIPWYPWLGWDQTNRVVTHMY
jgi:hypothetical protein